MPRSSILLLTAAGVVVRLAFLALEPASSLAGDEHTWTIWGAQVLAGPEVAFSPLRFQLIFYPPLYPYFIGVCYSLFGSLTAVKICQAAAGALLIPAAGRLGTRAFGRTTGLVAAGIAAFYPDLVWFSVHFWSETLFLVLLYWALERLLAADASGSRSAAVLAGLLWGLAILTRETALYFTPVAVVWLAWRAPRRTALSAAAAFLLSATLVVAPWTYRNWVVYRAFVPVSTAGALNLWQGNAGLPRQEIYDLYAAVHGRIEKYRHARRMGLAAIRTRQPGWIFEKLRDEMPLFWEADSLALVHIRRGAYGPVSGAMGAGAELLILTPYLACLPLFVLGVAACRMDRAQAMLLGFLVYYNLLHVATHGFARYRLPVMPLLFLFAAQGLLAWRAGRLRSLDGRRLAVAAAMALVLGLSVAPSLVSAWRGVSFSEEQTAPAGEVGPEG